MLDDGFDDKPYSSDFITCENNLISNFLVGINSTERTNKENMLVCEPYTCKVFLQLLPIAFMSEPYRPLKME